ncbi:MAG: hydantoinase B/oxoprolinase family protein [Acidimicrobiales bacterium]|nr:hydantoinase B/oxoprolinase family protein [Acidimicrobiales bacterium]
MDDLTAEILRNALTVAAEEASIVVVRSAYSAFVVEGSDASAAILDADGRLVAQSTATSLAHSASLHGSLPALLEDHPLDAMAPGDVFVMNDAYRGGIHPNDLLVFQPVFVDGTPRWFTATLIHVADVGGMVAGGSTGVATEVFQEGLQLPPVRVATAAGPADDVLAILALNSRTPAKVLGDLQALISGTTVARRRLEALCEEHGAAGLSAGIDAYLAYTEQRMRRAIEAIDDGVHRGSFTIDNDGVHAGASYRIEVALTVDGSDVTIDFAGTDPQVAASINAGYSQTRSGAIYGLRCFVDPTIPMNEGALAPLAIVAPEGSLLNPRPPAPCGGRFFAMYAVVDAIAEAMADARPDLAMASSGILTPFTLTAAEGEGVPWIHLAFEFGGVGARRGKDGPNATGFHFGLGRNMVPQVEPIEARCPLVVEELSLRVDSGGPGRWRGGLGTRTTYRLVEDALVTTRGDRHEHPPQGREGAGSGTGGGYYRSVEGEGRERLADKAANVVVGGGQRFVVETSGGGGLGSPRDRPVAEVAADVRKGWVSPAAAASVYGVVVASDGAVDQDATAARRADAVSG